MNAGLGRIVRLTGALFGALVISGCTQGPARESANLTDIRDDWVVSEAEALRWHEIKDEKGPALTGNESWQQFMELVEQELDAAGVVDIERNAWTFDRWQTSDWPDKSGWSLSVAGQGIEVASYGANSGSTGPEGITATLIVNTPDLPPAELEGKIVVFRTVVDSTAVRQFADADYEFLSPPDSFPERGGEVPGGLDNRQSAAIFLQLLQIPAFIDKAIAGGAVGAVFALDAGTDLAAGMYTFPVPSLHEVPSLYVDRSAGEKLVALAGDGAAANLRLEAVVQPATAYQLVGFLPGRNYGTEDDEVVVLKTHTDGPSISQDNGAFGILGVVRYLSNIVQEQRPRTVMVYLDCRHFMPGMEAAFAGEDWFVRNPDGYDAVIGLIGIEHLGQVEYVEQGGRLVETGRVYPSHLWAGNNDELVAMAIRAVRANKLPSGYVRNVAVPGKHGRSQGQWYGMAKHAPSQGIPAFGMMGFMGAYWATASGVERFDAQLFRQQVATIAQLTGEMLLADLETIDPKHP